MLDACSVLASICSLVWAHYILVICRRIQQVDGIPCPRVIFNQLRLFRRYWELAPGQRWSRVPVFLAGAAFLVGLISYVEVAVLLMSRTQK